MYFVHVLFSFQAVLNIAPCSGSSGRDHVIQLHNTYINIHIAIALPSVVLLLRLRYVHHSLLTAFTHTIPTGSVSGKDINNSRSLTVTEDLYQIPTGYGPHLELIVPDDQSPFMALRQRSFSLKPFRVHSHDDQRRQRSCCIFYHSNIFLLGNTSLHGYATPF